VLLSPFSANIYAQLATAASELNQRTEAFRHAKYEDAAQHFQNVVSLAPGNKIAHLYLATALAQQYIPGVEAPDNLHVGQAAIEEYRAVLDLDPKSRDAVQGIAYLDLQMKKFEEAKEYYRRSIELDPDNPEPYFSIGVIDWTQVYQRRMQLRGKLGLKPDKPFINAVECSQLRSANEDVVKDGMERLTQALKLRPDYDDAMAYMNLLYRERADIQCGDRKAYDSDIRTADKWVDLTMGTKKQKVEKPEHSSETTAPPQ